jgi:hypothetical protein
MEVPRGTSVSLQYIWEPCSIPGIEGIDIEGEPHESSNIDDLPLQHHFHTLYNQLFKRPIFF